MEPGRLWYPPPVAPGAEPGRGTVPRPMWPWGKETGVARGPVDMSCSAPPRGAGGPCRWLSRGDAWLAARGRWWSSQLSFPSGPTVWGHPGGLRASEEGHTKKLPAVLRRTGFSDRRRDLDSGPGWKPQVLCTTPCCVLTKPFTAQQVGQVLRGGRRGRWAVA